MVCCTMLWEGESVRRLIEMLGGVYSQHLSSYCTHVVTARTNTHRFRVARHLFPDIPIVHPCWLWSCYRALKKVPDEPHRTDFCVGVARTGTCRALGTRDEFFAELPKYMAAEHHVGVPNLASLMRYEGYDRDNPDWGVVSRALQGTVFWGSQVRQMNWRRRRTLALCLLLQRCSVPAPRKRMRRCRDGPVPALRRVAALPAELKRTIIQYC